MPLDLFSKTPLPHLLPDEIQIIIDELKTSPSQKACLQTAYALLIKKYHGERVKTYTKFFDIFIHDIDILWKKNNFLHCTNLNYLMRTLLIRSGFFTEEDIRIKWTLIWYISPHQYLQIKVSDTWINIDIWAHAYGIEFGDNAHGFH